MGWEVCCWCIENLRLKRSTKPVTHREGGDPSTFRVSPSTWKYELITLERGVTHDNEFEKWANLVHIFGDNPSMSLKNFHKDIISEKSHIEDP